MNAHHRTDSGDHRPENLVPVCIACHAVLHVGRSLADNIVAAWKRELSQVEVVQGTREGIRQRMSLADTKSSFLSLLAYTRTWLGEANAVSNTSQQHRLIPRQTDACGIITSEHCPASHKQP